MCELLGQCQPECLGGDGIVVPKIWVEKSFDEVPYVISRPLFLSSGFRGPCGALGQGIKFQKIVTLSSDSSGSRHSAMTHTP